MQIMLLAAVLLQSGVLAERGSGAAGAEAGTIHGIVRAHGSLEPLPHGVVRVDELGRVAPTDAKGYFVLAEVPAGRWRAEATAIGYAPHALVIIVSSGTVRIDFELLLRPVPMPVLEVRATPAGEMQAGATPLPRAGPAAVRVHSMALRTVPGLAEPDVLRALQTLPSVAAMSDFSTALYVRGGAADQAAITLDGIPLFNPYHVGGLFTAIPVDAVSAVDVWAGAMPARALDRLSGAVHIHSRDGARDHIRVGGGVGLLSSHLTVDGPLGPVSFIATGRRTYLDAMTDAVYALSLTDVTVPYGFSDVYAKLTLSTGGLGSLSWSGYHNSETLVMPDRMRERSNQGSGPNFDWGSGMSALNYRQPLGRSVLLESRLGYSTFRGAFEAWQITDSYGYSCQPGGDCTVTHSPRDSTNVLSADTRSSDILAGVDLTWYRARHTLRAGAQLDSYRIDHDFRRIDDVQNEVFAPFRSRAAPRTLALHVEDEWQATDRVTARLGARVLVAGALGSAVLPRAGINLQLTSRLSLSAGAGAYAQALRSLRNDESVVSSLTAYDLPVAQPAEAGLARATDAVIGVGITGVSSALRAELYARRMSGLVLPPAAAEPTRAPALVVDSFRIGDGRARGLELSAQHRHRGVELGLGYTLSVADRLVDGERYTARYERRHTLDANAVLHWSERGLLSARIAVASGQPYTPAVGITETMRYDAATDSWEHAGARVVLGDHNSGRLPSYLRADVAARREYSRRWFGRPVTVTPYVQILNVLNTRNVLIGEAEAQDQPLVRHMPQFPILPTFGFEWRH